MNLFLSTRSLTGKKEDHLTAFFAAAIEVSEPVRRGYFDLVLRSFAAARDWGKCDIDGVITQCPFDDTTCRPDLLLTLSNGKRIVCEHKIESVETAGPPADDRGQLERYLRLPVDGVVYVRASWKPPGREILRHRKYVRPASGEHFLWRDFFPLLEGSVEPVVRWLREGFERLGYTPPGQMGELTTDDERRNFAKLWAKTKSFAHDLGWEIGVGSVVQLYFSNNRRSTASVVFVQPVANRFQIRVTPRRGRQQACFEAMEAAVKSCDKPVQAEVNRVSRSGGKETVFDLYAAANDVLGRTPQTPPQLEEKLYRFVSHFVAAIQTP